MVDAVPTSGSQRQALVEPPVPHGWGMRRRLLACFVGLHLLLTVTTGIFAWRAQHGFLVLQAEQRAQVIATLAPMLMSSPSIRAKTEELTGYRIRLLDGPEEMRPGTVQVADPVLGRTIEVVYVNDDFRRAELNVLWATAVAVAAGSLAFAGLAWLVARALARPLEALAGTVARLGRGEWERPIAPVGSGELRALALTIEAARRRLVELDAQHRQAERLATLGTFTATIAHEVRNPLAAIQLALQSLARRHRDASITLALEEIQRVDLIVDELLGYSRGFTVTLGSCELGTEADAVCSLLARQARHAGVVLRTAGTAAVRADPQRIRQVLLNLVANAIQAQHGAGVGEVLIDIHADGFSVADRGPGVAPALRPRLFEAFASDKPEGTGLGLHLARAIIEAHGAQIAYRDGEPGAMFTVSGLKPA